MLFHAMKNISRYIDFAFCIVLLPLMVMIFPVERWFHNFQWYVLSVGGWLYILYFVNRIFTVPLMFKGPRMVWAGISLVALSLVVTYCFSCVTLYTPKPNIHDIGIPRMLPYIQQYQQAVWCLFMIVEAFSFAIGLLTQIYRQRVLQRALEAEKHKAEIKLYKAQIKPHFMFNTLNSLYGLFLTNNENALASLEKFISMMRYIHTSSTCDMVPLCDEVDYIRQYVGLQSLRLNEMTTVELDIAIENKCIAVPPMLLITFVENCFKHGVSPIEESRIAISIKEHGGVLKFRTSNHIFPVKHIGENMGIDNCRKRLALLYPNRHRLSIKTEDGSFIVKLQINLSA